MTARPRLPIRPLPEHPSLDQLKRQAKELLSAFRASEATAVAEVHARYHDADPSTFSLHDAQLVLARAHGFDSWPKVKAYIDGVTVTRLADAVRANDLDRVRAMLDARPELVDMDMSEHNEHRAIHYAVLTRAPAMVRLLMERGSDARKGIWPHRDATSALTIATERGYDEIVDIIRAGEGRRGSGQPDPRSSPALHRYFAAVSARDESAAIAVLEDHPSLIHERAPGDGWTPLHLATSILSERLVTWLLDRGADINAANTFGNTPLAVAGSRCGWTEGTEALAGMRNLLIQRGAELTVWVAVALGDVDWIRMHRHESPRWTNEFIAGLLTTAVHHGREEIVRLLVELGLDPDERSRLEGLEEVVYSWGGPLRECAASSKLAIAEILLEHGADPNTNVYAASSAMFNAYEARDWAMVTLLERYGGFVDAVVAAHFGLVDQARQMLADEAAGRLRDRTVWPGASVAEALLVSGADGGHPDIVSLALAHLDWPAGDSRWHGFLMRPLGGHANSDRDRYVTCFRLILERSGAAVPGAYGRTILHDVAAAWPTVHKTSADERVTLATVLLDAGARVDVRDDLLESTPLGWACRWGRVELVKLLLDRGADPVERNAAPWATPLAWAQKRGHEEIAALLRGRSRHA